MLTAKRAGTWVGIGSLLGWLAGAGVVLAGVAATGPAQAATTDFVSTWKTNNTSVGSSDKYQVKLPLESGGTYNFAVDWESDGTVDQTITSWDQAIHTYPTQDTYTVTIRFPNKSSKLEGWTFADGGDLLKILNISQWGGKINFGNGGHYFQYATNLTCTATDSPDLTGTTNLSFMFADTDQFNGDLSQWDTASVTDMSGMFNDAKGFNQPIGTWNTGSVTTMAGMFGGATTFNQPIGGWNTSKVTKMGNMFGSATAFNQNISSWTTANVTTMGSMFYGATGFNQQIGDWNTSNVTDMSHMFGQASGFNQNLGGWDVGKVANMDTMFNGSGLSTTNYDKALVGWGDRSSLQPNVPLGAQGIQYSCTAKANRQHLVTGHGWVITDAGLGPCVSVTPDPVVFAATPVGRTNSVTVTVANPGGAGLVLPYGAIILTDLWQFAVTGDTCSGATVPPFGVCTATVRFSPSSAGNKTAWLNVWSNAASSPNTVTLSGTGVSAPHPPTAVTAVAGDAQVTVSWSPPADDGSSPILEYMATAEPGGATCTTTGTSCVVAGLANGTPYTFTVTARNAIGMSAASALSAPVTPAAPAPPVQPPAPPVQPPTELSGVKATLGKGSVMVTWKASAGATSYWVRISKPGGKKYKAWKTTTKRVFKAKVKKGKKYRFQVVAVGAGGRGPVTTIGFKGK